MSYGKKLTIRNKTFLILSTEEHKSISLMKSKDDYETLFEGNYKYLDWNIDKLLTGLDFEDRLTKMIHICVVNKKIFTQEEIYQYEIEQLKRLTKLQNYTKLETENIIYSNTLDLPLKAEVRVGFDICFNNRDVEFYTSKEEDFTIDLINGHLLNIERFIVEVDPTGQDYILYSKYLYYKEIKIQLCEHKGNIFTIDSLSLKRLRYTIENYELLCNEHNGNTPF